MDELRQSTIDRKTNETEILLSLGLDDPGLAQIEVGIPFFEHMLQLLTKHAGFNLQLTVRGDLSVDGHHTVEDVGICLGLALKEALGSKQGIKRYGSAIIPMDEALTLVAVDLSGRGFLAFDAVLPTPMLGSFETELVEEFLRALAMNGAFNLHVRLLAGKNTHHIIEAIFKALGYALRDAVAASGRGGLPSTKGLL